MPVKRAKSWFFFNGSSPAPIIYQPTISPSFYPRLKEFILVVLPKSRGYWFSSNLLKRLRLPPRRRDFCEDCSCLSLDNCRYYEGGRSDDFCKDSLFLSPYRKFFFDVVRILLSILGRKPYLLFPPTKASFVNAIFFSSFSRCILKEVCLNLSLRFGTGGITYSNHT